MYLVRNMDVAFSIQQFGLSPCKDVFRAILMDDANDVLCNCKSEDQAVSLAIENDIQLNKQSISVGFKKNETKTTFIPMNINKQKFLDAGIEEKYILTETGILGFNFSVINSKFNVAQAASDTIASICQFLWMIHACRSYIESHETRVKIARTVIFYFLGNLPLIYVYGELPSGKNDNLKRIQTKINDMIRATGLINTTPQLILDKCLGTSIADFCKQAVVCDALKLLKFYKIVPFDRVNQIRSSGMFGLHGTYMHKFRKIWNEFEPELRAELREKTVNQVKEVLKSRRKLKYDPEIFIRYKWHDYSGI